VTPVHGFRAYLTCPERSRIDERKEPFHGTDAGY
jgi:hypothetical protein